MALTLFEEAANVIANRRVAYDERERNFSRIAAIWSVVFGREVTPAQVALCMIGTKLAREVYKPGRDNRVDICGYADCLEDLLRATPEEACPTAPADEKVTCEGYVLGDAFRRCCRDACQRQEQGEARRCDGKGQERWHGAWEPSEQCCLAKQAGRAGDHYPRRG